MGQANAVGPTSIEGSSFLVRCCCQLCGSDELWEHLYREHNDSSDVADDLRAHAKRVGWRRVFFANKIQLQVGYDIC